MTCTNKLYIHIHYIEYSSSLYYRSTIVWRSDSDP